MFSRCPRLLGAWGQSKRPMWLKGKAVKGDWRRLVKQKYLKQWTEEERRVNQELLGADAPVDYVPPPNITETPKWLRDLRRRSFKTKLQPTTEAERLFVQFDHWALEHPQAKATTEQVAEVWAACEDDMDLNLAAQVLHRGAMMGAKLTPALFTTCVEACCHTGQLDVARYLVDNYRLLGFRRVHLDDIVRIRRSTADAASAREPKTPFVIRSSLKQEDSIVEKLVVARDNASSAVHSE
eukprot:EG_transcript_25226